MKKYQEPKTDFDKWGDRLIVLAVVLLPVWIIIRALWG